MFWVALFFLLWALIFTVAMTVKVRHQARDAHRRTLPFEMDAQGGQHPPRS
jgi:hypothetical protein